MTGAWEPMLLRRLHRHRASATAVGVTAALLLLIWAALAPSASVAAGWLIGFLFWLAIAVGALLLVAIHALTGGRWGAAARPMLLPAAASTPAFLLFGLPVLFSLSGLFPWVSDPASAPPGVAPLYLNSLGWGLRAAVALSGWSILAFLLLRRDGRHRLAAAIGLCFHGVIITPIGIDWILSLDGRFYSSAFGAAFATLQLLAALAWLAAARGAPAGAAGRSGDIGGLMIATALASLYLGFSQYLVIWYGNIPERVSWYLERTRAPWYWVDLVAIVLSGILPVLVLMRQRWRNDPGVLAFTGRCVMFGLFAHLLWLVAPRFGLLAIPAAVLALVAIGASWLALTYGFVARRLELSGAR